MTDPGPRSPNRSIALSREQIVRATIELLDSLGESALTVRALTAHLATGRGAIYHYVDGKDELLAAAADGVIGAVFEGAVDDPDPRQSLRILALAIFDALTAHTWLGTQLGREPMQPAVLRIWKGFGMQLQRLGLTGDALSNAGAALVNYLLGASAQYTTTFDQHNDRVKRRAYLEVFAAELIRIDSDTIAHETAATLVEHDDREQFLVGINIFLAGVEATEVTGTLATDGRRR